MAAKSWNKVELMGNLTRDPELRFTPNGAAVCTFGMATNRSYMVDGERREEVDFHRLVAWNKLAEICNQLLKKGTRVFISGRLQYREWETPEKVKRREAEIVVDDMIIVTPKGGSTGATGDDFAEAFNHEETAPIASKATEPKAEELVEEVKEKEESASSDDSQGKKKSPAPDESIAPDEDLPF